MKSLSKNWVLDDSPHYFQGAIENPEDYVTWSEVEYCLNNPHFYDLEFIKDGQKVQMREYQYVWGPHHKSKRDCFDAFNDGCGLIINNFEHMQGKQSILKDIEKQFPAVHCGMHVYCGLKGHGSFNIHEDLAMNFIIQIEGKTDWTVYKQRASYMVPQSSDLLLNNTEALDVDINVTMEAGDVLYIPARQYHCARPEGKRLSLSVPMIARMYVEHCMGEERDNYGLN